MLPQINSSNLHSHTKGGCQDKEEEEQLDGEKRQWDLSHFCLVCTVTRIPRDLAMILGTEPGWCLANEGWETVRAKPPSLECFHRDLYKLFYTARPLG